MRRSLVILLVASLALVSVSGSGVCDMNQQLGAIEGNRIIFTLPGTEWVDVHYKINGGNQLNFRMNQEGNRFTAPLTNAQGSRIEYSFTYHINGVTCDSNWAISSVGMAQQAISQSKESQQQAVMDISQLLKQQQQIQAAEQRKQQMPQQQLALQQQFPMFSAQQQQWKNTEGTNQQDIQEQLDMLQQQQMQMAQQLANKQQQEMPMPQQFQEPLPQGYGQPQPQQFAQPYAQPQQFVDQGYAQPQIQPQQFAQPYAQPQQFVDQAKIPTIVPSYGASFAQPAIPTLLPFGGGISGGGKGGVGLGALGAGGPPLKGGPGLPGGFGVGGLGGGGKGGGIGATPVLLVNQGVPSVPLVSSQILPQIAPQISYPQQQQAYAPAPSISAYPQQQGFNDFMSYGGGAGGGFPAGPGPIDLGPPLGGLGAPGLPGPFQGF